MIKMAIRANGTVQLQLERRIQASEERRLDADAGGWDCPGRLETSGPTIAYWPSPEPLVFSGFVMGTLTWPYLTLINLSQS